ncbi:hypothetical protein B7494_g8616 [Chlorociboria aeruginascens]|nr:hypothetical protein B7494_g8616 [Chlorociboria aeruginascens]
MVKPSIIRMLSVIRTSLLNLSDGSSIQQFLRLSTPSFTFLRDFFSTWLKLDITELAAALTIFGTISSALQDLKILGLKLYWWITKLFTASISIASTDRLNREVVNWLGAQILTRQETRILTARSETIQNDAWAYRRVETERNDYHHEKRVPIQYLPTFGTLWFIYERHLLMVRRIPTSMHMADAMGVPTEYVAAPRGDEPLVIICLGRSVAPIKKFLEDCREFADKQRESFITVRASKSLYGQDSWDTTILRAIRPLETVHFDETMKQELITDIRNYLDPNTRRFYTARGIPYRRGYLLFGAPGCGKTSLALALAGYFNLELYLLHVPTIGEDNGLENLFTALPPKCIVLLEDIDAVGMRRKARVIDESNEDEDDDDDDDDKDTVDRHSRSRITLSGLLNVLDGVASQEGRIVLMTSNFADQLDRALVRPGRIDKMILLGNISQRSAELMFLRMFTPERSAEAVVSLGCEADETQKLALEFSSKITEDMFTPAQLQGFLLNYRSSPQEAVAKVSTWVAEETARIEEAKLQAKKVAEWRAKKRKEAKLRLLHNFVDKDLENVPEAPADDKTAKKEDGKESAEAAEGKVEGKDKVPAAALEINTEKKEIEGDAKAKTEFIPDSAIVIADEADEADEAVKDNAKS